MRNIDGGPVRNFRCGCDLLSLGFARGDGGDFYFANLFIIMLAEVINEMINAKKSLMNLLWNEYFKPVNEECKQLIAKTTNKLYNELAVLERIKEELESPEQND